MDGKRNLIRKLYLSGFTARVLGVSVIFAMAFSALPQSTAYAYDDAPGEAIIIEVEGQQLEQMAAPAPVSLFLPIAAKQYEPQPPTYPLPLGTVNLLSGPTVCGNESCYQIEVSCASVSRPEQATLKVGEPVSNTVEAGTILFATGWIGNYYWDEAVLVNLQLQRLSLAGLDPAQATGNNLDILNNLRAAGFRTVQLKWQRNWFEAETGHVEGMANLACKPATVTRWVYDNLHLQGEALPYCATGHSNGASEMAFGLTHYGLSDILSAVVLESGPNWSYIDHACLHDDAKYSNLHADQGERNTIDWGFGFPSDGTGACAVQDVTFRDTFRSASLVTNGWQYAYPHTMVAFVFGGDDNTTTAAQGQVYYDRLLRQGTPHLSMQVVSGAPHFVTTTTDGAQAMQSTLLTECALR